MITKISSSCPIAANLSSTNWTFQKHSKLKKIKFVDGKNKGILHDYFWLTTFIGHSPSISSIETPFLSCEGVVNFRAQPVPSKLHPFNVRYITDAATTIYEFAVQKSNKTTLPIIYRQPAERRF